jgi:hypothetical protein
MSDDSSQMPGAAPVEPVPTPEEKSAASAAWSEVVTELDALGAAIGRWVKASVSDEENKRRAAELKAAFEKLAGDVSETVKDAADSEVGQSFKEAADKTGEAFKKAGEKISEEAGPKIASAFRTLSEKLGASAQKMEERAEGKAEGGAGGGTEAPAETGAGAAGRAGTTVPDVSEASDPGGPHA